MTRDIDYVIDYTKGHISFLKPLFRGSTPEQQSSTPEQRIEIEYDIIPLGIQRVYKRELFLPKHQRLETPLATPERLRPLEPRPGVAEPIAPPPSALRVTGTKTFSISLGSNRDLTPDQSLRLNVDGKVSENVSVIAMLSDQDLPFQPEGTTESIEDLDQKLIRISSPHISATLGDYEGAIGDSEVAFPRALEGVQVQGNYDWGSFSVIPSAIPRGQSASKIMQGYEGQSEYRADVDGQYIVMKSGSEIVWLNGERMRRGEDNDYVIRDYGDPIIEFTSRHLITSNDIIRVDFEYIPEDMTYKQSLYGFGGKLKLWDGDGMLGLSYAVEADDKNKPYIILSDEDVHELQQNELDADGDGKLLTAPKKHSVLGFDSQFNLGENTSLIGKLAFSDVDNNTFSKLDNVETSRAWSLSGHSYTEKLRLNCNLRGLDAGFVPIGATGANRSRFRYEEQYQEEQFGDVFLLGAPIQRETPAEHSADADIQYEPIAGIKLDSGLGWTSENYDNEELPDTARKNWRRGVDVNFPGLPRFRTRYQESTTTTDGQEDFKKTRERFDITHRFGKLNLNLFEEKLASVDLNPTDYYNRNRKRNERGLKVEIVNVKWASLFGEYSFEESFKKDINFTIDGQPLTLSDWILSTTARTASIRLSSRPRAWANLSTTFSRRVFKELPKSETKTNLADASFRLKPFRGAIDADVNYQIDKKLATERIEIYTNMLYGRPIQPGQGMYVKIDEYHYEEDYENGDYIKFVQTVGDKPVSAVDIRFRLYIKPYRILAARRKQHRQNFFFPEAARPGLPSADRFQQQTEQTRKKTKFSLKGFLAKSFTGDVRLTITEEQENADQWQLYLLRNLQTDDTILGRTLQQYRMEFSPTLLFTVDVEYSTRRQLNKRIHSRERKYQSNQWNLRARSAPVARFSLEAEWEKRCYREHLIDLGIQGDLPRTVTNIIGYERTSSLTFQYDITDKITLGLEGSYETGDDTDVTDAGRDTSTRSLSLENRWIYSLRGKGRVNFSYQITYGISTGDLPLARYNFYDGLSHEVRCRADYQVRKFTDLILRFNYRLLATEQNKPEHRAQMEVVAEL